MAQTGQSLADGWRTWGIPKAGEAQKSSSTRLSRTLHSQAFPGTIPGEMASYPRSIAPAAVWPPQPAPYAMVQAVHAPYAAQPVCGKPVAELNLGLMSSTTTAAPSSPDDSNSTPILFCPERRPMPGSASSSLSAPPTDVKLNTGAEAAAIRLRFEAPQATCEADPRLGAPPGDTGRKPTKGEGKVFIACPKPAGPGRARSPDAVLLGRPVPSTGGARTPVPGGTKMAPQAGTRIPVQGAVKTPMPNAAKAPLQGALLNQLGRCDTLKTPVPGGVRTPVSGGVLTPGPPGQGGARTPVSPLPGARSPLQPHKVLLRAKTGGADLTPPSPTPATGSPALVKSKTGLNARRVPSPVLGHRLETGAALQKAAVCLGRPVLHPRHSFRAAQLGRLADSEFIARGEKAAQQVTRTCSEGEDALHKLHGSASLIKDALESKQKLQKYAKSCFQASDANGDGQVSFEELCKCMQKMNADLGIGDFTERHVMHYLQRFDTDGDELLNEKEFQELYRALLLVKLEDLAGVLQPGSAMALYLLRTPNCAEFAFTVEVEPADFSRDMFIGRRKGKPEDNYEVFGIVGVGSFGVVRKVKCKLTGTTRVMKVVDKQKALNGGYPLKLIMEDRRSTSSGLLTTRPCCGSSNLFFSRNGLAVHVMVPMVLVALPAEYCADALNLYLFTDMLPGGDLLDIVEGSYNKKRRIEEPGFGSSGENWVRDVFRQAAEGVAYCHAKGVMHKDLKLENIMLASVQPPEAVVIDVGLAELFPPSEADSFSSADPAGTLATMAPEVIRGNFNAKCDVWSLGCCLYALLCHKPLRLEDVKGEGKGEVELYDYFYPFSPPPDESRPEPREGDITRKT
eukprot:s4347_g5.t1